MEEFNKAVKQRNRSPHSSCVSDDNAEGGSESSGNNSGEDDEMESVISSRRTSGFADDMEVNGISLESQKPRPLEDSDGVRDMEGINYVAESDLKLGAVAAAVHEVATVAGVDWVAGVGSVVRNLRHLGFTAMSEEGYASAIYSLLKVIVVI